MGDDVLLSSPSGIDRDNLRLGEKIAEGILQRIHPTEVSDQRRGEVVEYVRDLIRGIASAETFPLGSVPLKTYLPDGDIDLTAIGPLRSEESLARDVLFILQAEEQKRSSQFDVKDVQYIRAEVKLVKCLVQNIVVDISFQRVGGLCTLCFLEKVDRILGKKHLFKRSILLIKAWCYYESRILGAHHSLISTYALETLILYIFCLFHPSLNGPLEVLYRFLDHFSQFDWSNYGVSLSGPVCLDSMSELAEDDRVDSLLSRDFLKKCEEDFGPALKLLDNASLPDGLFPRKHLNIVDPLKANNNLGRSVNLGSFHRIRSAFKLGAKELGGILRMPREKISGELSKFFTNTLNCHGGIGGSETENLNSLSFVTYGAPYPSSSISPDFRAELFEDIAKLRISELGELSSSSPPSSSMSSSSTSSSSSISSSSESLGLSNLAGDYHSCMMNLLYAVGFLERCHPPSYANYGGLYPSHMNAMASSYYPLGVGPAFFTGPFGVEDAPRTRGLGTYFPNVSHSTYRGRRPTGRGRGPPHSTHSSRHTQVKEKLTVDKVNGYIWKRPAQSDETENELEFGSLGAIKLQAPPLLLPPPPSLSLPSPPPPHLVGRLEFGSLGADELLPPPAEREKVNGGLADERLEHGFHLKNEEDFPPLGGLVRWS